jgi:hypothetical protein
MPERSEEEGHHFGTVREQQSPRFIPKQQTTPYLGGSGGNSGQNQLLRNNQPFKHPIQELQ